MSRCGYDIRCSGYTLERLLVDGGWLSCFHKPLHALLHTEVANLTSGKSPTTLLPSTNVRERPTASSANGRRPARFLGLVDLSQVEDRVLFAALVSASDLELDLADD